MYRSTYSRTSRASEGRGSSLTLGASAPVAQFTSAMRSEKAEPSACETAEVKGSSPASIPSSSNPRIGRELLGPSYGDLGVTGFARSMGYARSPNKSPEPTSCAVTSRAIGMKIELKRHNLSSNQARAMPAQAVAHL